MKLVEVRLCCGRLVLFVAGIAVAMEGDKCRHSGFPESILPRIPAEELATASIGGKPCTDLPIEMVRFFRGDNWNAAMLEYTATAITMAIEEAFPWAHRRIK